ncbi:MAG: flippase-like domain-containing protein [Actinomycetota bacterium]|nr:flippase-like domain-containing protein [Actinomycetota bacterium]
MNRSPWVKVAQTVFVVVVAVFFVRVASDNVSDLREVDLHLRPWRLLLALPVAVAIAPVLPLAWRQLVTATRHDIEPRRAVGVWYVGQTARYLPTGLVAFASRALLAARFGVPQPVTVATVAVELGLIITTGGGLAAACLPSSELAGPLRVVIAAGAVAGLLVGPHLIRWASGRIKQLDPHAAGGWSTIRLYEAEGLFLLNQVAKSLAFVLFVSALQPVRGGDVWLLIGAFNAANTLGTVGITPAGLGVREGVMAAILADRYGLGDGAAIAVAARVWDTAIELIWLAIVQISGFRAAPKGQEPH